jgi:pyruvate/2-oxoglutarate/acetoin dehydrogenase E1 component
MSLPLVITGACGAGMRLGNEHAMLVHNMIAQVPGIKVCMPSTPYDAKGLMTAAIRDDNPVAFLWHLGTMMDRGPVPEEPYVVPLGVAEVKREGCDVTLVANGFQYKNAQIVADKLAGEISVEIIDPRTFSPLDIGTILKSLEKTGRLVVVDESWESRSTASEIAAQVVDLGFDLLDAPIRRVTIPNIPLPGGHMEPYVAPNPAAIEAAVRDVCR